MGTGRYKLKFNGGETGYGSEWYNDKTDSWNADVVEITDPTSVTGINAELVASGSISGKVTDIDGTPITYCDIFAFHKYGSVEEFHINTINGDYTVSGLPAGQYKLSFITSGYATAWYGDKNDFTTDQALFVTVNSGATVSDINIVLKKGGTVSGRVTNSNNVGIPDVHVVISTVITQRGYSATTDVDGDYDFAVLATGNWVIEFDAEYKNTGYANQWYDNKISEEDADPVYISAPNIVTINAQLEQSTNSGSISGRITDGKNPLFGVNVSVYDSNYSWIKFASTNCAGEYSVGSLAEGTYKVSFSDYTYGFSSEWYNDKADFESADPITVTNSSPATGIDAVLSSGLPNGQQMPLSPIMMLLLNH